MYLSSLQLNSEQDAHFTCFYITDDKERHENTILRLQVKHTG